MTRFHRFFLVLAGWLCVLCLPQAHALNTIANGFSWVENLCFDSKGNLFVSENTHGEIWRIYRGETQYAMELMQDDFKSVLGMAYDPENDEIFAVVVRLDGRWRLPHNYLVGFKADYPGMYRIVAELSCAGNGLALHGGHAYITTAGTFLPGQAAVYRINLDTGIVGTFVNGLTHANGLAIDDATRQLYVGELATGKVHVHDLRDGERLHSVQVLQPLHLEWLDDIVLDAGGQRLYGVDFAKGRVVSVDLNARPDDELPISVVLDDGVTNPTAIAWGRGPGFDSCSLYITEGGGITGLEHNRRVLELRGVRCGSP